jgi:very-short-patch-repair endonuclease
MELRRGITKARTLRVASTDVERVLWTHLRGRRLGKFKFRRQLPIAGYVVDFACIEARLVVELDGGQHANRVAQDNHRTTILEKNGFRVLRFWNDEVLKNLEGVLEETLRYLQTPSHPASPR